MGNRVVYQHLKPNGEIFYISIGSINRAKTSCKRNNLWYKILNKYKDFKVEILYDNLTLIQACKLEKELILQYGRIHLNTGTLANLTEGGEGSHGYKHTKEAIEKIKNNSKGRKAWNKGIKSSEVTRIKLSKGKVIHLKTNIIYDGLSLACEKLGLDFNKEKDRVIKNYNTKQFKYVKDGRNK